MLLLLLLLAQQLLSAIKLHSLLSVSVADDDDD